MKTEWKNDNNRFVAFLDIMGFKAMVNSKPHEFVKEKLEIISGVNQHIVKTVNKIQSGNKFEEFKNCDLRVTQFSDSTVLFTNDNSVADFKYISFAVRTIIQKSLENGIPIKGAMSLGLMTVDFEKSIFVGRPLIEAYLLQEEVAYYGFILDSDAEKFWRNNMPEDEHFYKFEKTPLKKGCVNHLNLKFGKDMKKKNLIQLYESVCGSVRLYVDNTLEMHGRLK